MAGEGRIKGSVNKPRERMLNALERQFPGFDPVVRMAELAEDSFADLKQRQEEHAKYRETGELPQGHPEDDPPPGRITNAERNTVGAMFERCAKFLVPQLKASEVKVDGNFSGDVVVRFATSQQEAEQAGG